MHSHDPANIPYTVVSKVCMGHYLAFSSPLQDPLSHRRKEIWGRNRSFSRKKFSTASLAYVYTLIDHSLTKDLQGSSIGAASVLLMCLGLSFIKFSPYIRASSWVSWILQRRLKICLGLVSSMTTNNYVIL